MTQPWPHTASTHAIAASLHGALVMHRRPRRTFATTIVDAAHSGSCAGIAHGASQ